MKKIFTLLNAMLLAVSVFAATEQAWYNDVTSITNNGQYYIYSVNGKGFMQAGQEQVKAITTSNYTNVSTFKFTIANPSEGTVKSGSYYLKCYKEPIGTSSGPINTKTENGTNIIFTSMNSGEYWNIHGHYNVFGQRYPALYYKNGEYNAYISGSGINYSNTKDLQTASEYRWYVVSQAQLDRHWAIYFFDLYKESVSNYTQYENLVPAAYYTALETAYSQTFDVTNAAHSAEVVNAAKSELENLYNNAGAVADAYAAAAAKIANLEAVEDKGEDFAEVTAGISAARQAIENALSVEALNAAVSAPNLKAIDPITFNVTSFMAISSVSEAASSAAGRTLSYVAADEAIINAGMAIYKGATTLTATAAATDAYYKFVRSAQVTVDAPTTYGDFAQTTCDEPVEFNEKTYTETTQEDVNAGLNFMGGDSIVHVSVVINHASFSEESKTIVYGAAEEWNGIALSDYTVGEHQVEYVTTNAVGCDSTITLHLTVAKQDVAVEPVELSFCHGGEVEFRGNTYTEAGNYTLEAEGAERDTLFQITVTELQSSETVESLTIQYGDKEVWNGIDLSTYAVGDYTEYFYTTNAAGCDSVVTLILTVDKKDAFEAEQELTFCDGDSAEYRGVWYKEAGDYTIEVEGEVQDTLITVKVNVYAVDKAVERMTVAAGDKIDLPEGEWLIGEKTFSGEYLTSEADVPELVFVQSGKTEEGCDAITELVVTVTSREGVENVSVEAKAEKFMRDGKLFIRRGEAIYTATGERVE